MATHETMTITTAVPVYIYNDIKKIVEKLNDEADRDNMPHRVSISTIIRSAVVEYIEKHKEALELENDSN